MHFSKIIGHNLQIQSLKRAFDLKRVSHSYLFHGPDGVGKKLVALEFAKLVNCLKKESRIEEPACECNSCKKIDKGIHPDVFLIGYKGVKDIKVDQIREEVEERLYFKPFEGRFKVAIVDEAQRMNTSAQNAFLKTLEEPPIDSIIILNTSQPQSLLPTIRSRCQMISFDAIPEEIIKEEISKRTELSDEDAIVIARLSEGNLGKALSLDSSILARRRELITKLSNLNSNSATSVLGTVESIPKGSSNEDIENLKMYLEIIMLWLRDLVHIKIGLDDDILTNRDLIEISKNYAAKKSVDIILDKLKYVEQVTDSIFRRNANKQIALENLVLKIAE